MRKETPKLEELVLLIGETQQFFKQQAQRQVNIALTLRNWLIGLYIVEYEQGGDIKADYGNQLIDKLSLSLTTKYGKGFSRISLRLYRAFYLAYPQIQQTTTVELYLVDFQRNSHLKNVFSKLIEAKNTPSLSPYFAKLQSPKDINTLINQISFSHFIELLKTENINARSFYEWQASINSWSVRELQRAMNSLLYERTGLSKNKADVLENHIKKETLIAEDIFRNPYILEFLELKEETDYSESDLEQAIINHLQVFLLELGKGFCFEARQKRITFDNTHYRIDLVFYHRILKCNILIDLKLGEFSHADAGQMNVYLNYFKEHEMNEGDNPPIGIILCANKNENLVKYATAGLPQQVFVSKYMINLPKEIDLKMIIETEQQKYNSNK
jgi:predicted nuclease of restriction endonuclease-like (RecB) superfamily